MARLMLLETTVKESSGGGAPAAMYLEIRPAGGDGVGSAKLVTEMSLRLPVRTPRSQRVEDIA